MVRWRVEFCIDNFKRFSNDCNFLNNGPIFKILKLTYSLSFPLYGAKKSALEMRKEIHAQMIYQGMPAIFLTVNPGDMVRWRDGILY